jgi:hypothetical protein
MMAGPLLSEDAARRRRGAPAQRYRKEDGIEEGTEDEEAACDEDQQ